MTAPTIVIAGATLALAVATPADLEQQLIATTGCGAGEIEQLLVAGADRVAFALAPLLAEDVDHVDLSNRIASDPAAIDAVRALYAALPATAPKPVAKTSESK